ncbi:MAG: hypothetical protein LUF85_03890 [Bacteroides sp.]|nr:hypothetical protein [Bacteroides sp.]
MQFLKFACKAAIPSGPHGRISVRCFGSETSGEAHHYQSEPFSVGWGSFKDLTVAQKASEKVTDYLGNVIYENGALKMILLLEGYITQNGIMLIDYYSSEIIRITTR